MAKLKNQANDLSLNLILYPDPNSHHWITYEIKLISIPEEKILLNLSSSEEYTLFFEASYEPEIPKICDGILKVVEGTKENFFFEPLDEKNFQIEVKKRDKLFIVDIRSDDFIVLENYRWWPAKSFLGVRMLVEKENILDFVKQLENEYEEIERKFPGKTFLPKRNK